MSRTKDDKGQEMAGAGVAAIVVEVVGPLGDSFRSSSSQFTRSGGSRNSSTGRDMSGGCEWNRQESEGQVPSPLALQLLFPSHPQSLPERCFEEV